jgi:protein-disulfide isomerase
MQARPIRIFLVLLVVVLTYPSLLIAATEQRLALVIGNSNYEASPLRNPVNDANDMARSLKNLGFKVILKTNASKRDMGKAVEDFGKRLKGEDVGLFYYAGHGVQVNGVNFLIPMGAKINDETDVEYEALDAGRILATMYNAKSKINIVILDACRDNPYVRSFRSTTRGLAIISKAPSGTIISYSTSPGDIALDGKGRNSPYTASLLRYMREPGFTVEQVFKNVRQQLNRETAGRQIPWELSSLEGDFYFNPGKSATAPEQLQTASIGIDKVNEVPKGVPMEAGSPAYVIDGVNIFPDKAVTIRGKSRNVIIEITDPDCVYCRKASEFLESKDATRHIYFYPLQTHPAAKDKALHVLCAANKVRAYQDVMSGKLDNVRMGDCKDKNARENLELHMDMSRQLGIEGTPTFYVNGQKVTGFIPGKINELLK